MRWFFLIAFSFVGVTFMMPRIVAASPGAPDPSGAWQRADGNARVHIAPCGADLCATNTWIKDSSDGEQVGDRLIMSVTPQSGSVLEGTAYDEKRRRTYSIRLDVGRSELTTKGCILYGLLCRSVMWSRLPDGSHQSN
jgi:uncharacterized protein (DUF2147 family)